MHEFYKHKKISDSLTIVWESYCDAKSLTLGLVTGKDKAVLIDAGLGAVDTLRTYVETLTDKPIICIPTHGHPDHAASAVLFDQTYMSKKDDPELSWGLTKERRLGDLVDFCENDPEVLAYCSEHCVDCTGFHYDDLTEGMTFDLGGVTLEALAMPGHTIGSMALINRKEEYIFTGDAVSEELMVTGYDIARLKECYQGLKNMVDICSPMKNLVIWSAHAPNPVPLQMAIDLRDCCAEILNGDRDSDVRTHFKYAELNDPDIVLYKHSKNGVSITYNLAAVSGEGKKDS